MSINYHFYLWFWCPAAHLKFKISRVPDTWYRRRPKQSKKLCAYLYLFKTYFAAYLHRVLGHESNTACILYSYNKLFQSMFFESLKRLWKTGHKRWSHARFSENNEFHHWVGLRWCLRKWRSKWKRVYVQCNIWRKGGYYRYQFQVFSTFQFFLKFQDLIYTLVR